MRRFRAWITVLALATGACATTEMDDGSARRALVRQDALRVGFLAGPLYATRDPATGEYSGVAIDLGRRLADRLGVPMRPVAYPNPAAVLAGAAAGEWDVAFMGVSPERAAAVDFSAPYMDVEQGVMVRAGAPVGAAADLDRPGLRVGVIANAGADALLSRTLTQATLVRARSTGELDAMLGAGDVDAIAATKTFLIGRLPSRPGARVLDGRILVEPIAMAVPRDRAPQAAQAVDRFVEDAKRSGWVGAAIERAGLRGVVVAPAR